MKYGVSLADLTPKQRSEIERNTGAVIDVVVEDTPSFSANVISGDVLIAVDGEDVKNAEHAFQLMRKNATTSSTLRIIRNKQEKDIFVKF